MPRRPKPDPEPYLRLILGISMNKKRLDMNEMNRLDFASALTEFVAIKNPRRDAFAAFIKKYTEENGVSKSFCYKVKARLEKLSLLKFEDYWQEYKINMNSFNENIKVLHKFKEQAKVWERKY